MKATRPTPVRYTSLVRHIQAWYACMPVWYNTLLHHRGMRPLQRDARRKRRLHFPFFFLFLQKKEPMRFMKSQPAGYLEPICNMYIDIYTFLINIYLKKNIYSILLPIEPYRFIVSDTTKICFFQSHLFHPTAVDPPHDLQRRSRLQRQTFFGLLFKSTASIKHIYSGHTAKKKHQTHLQRTHCPK